MTETALFFAGALLCNAIPHLAAGLIAAGFLILGSAMSYRFGKVREGKI